MQRLIFSTFVFGCLACLAHAGGDPIKDAPSQIHLRSGKLVKVLSVTRTTLHGSDEPALSLQYVTSISLRDIEKLYSEVEEVFDAIRHVAEREKLRAAVVTANEQASGLIISVSPGAGWCWKQRTDGSWGEPDESDHARVPK